MQLEPDWRTLYSSPEDIEKDLPGFKFHGPGMYLTKTDTVIIIPRPPENAPTPENVWNIKQPEGTIWEFHCYNVPFQETIFAAIAIIPNRQDER